ncbi:uncharacterized protein EAF01_002436 [Botrytis porri]|uniref:uncharacterized protein n=1 Tax=Botrytis porri TaxID=87229 RepID=UPI0019006B71|nr:uncharacterized protein EAF01_002436 [Botrytis porri]KAF7910927.1 hypothetical protein EAF01_002436 [Botrytis porri]
MYFQRTRLAHTVLFPFPVNFRGSEHGNSSKTSSTGQITSSVQTDEAFSCFSADHFEVTLSYNSLSKSTFRIGKQNKNIVSEQEEGSRDHSEKQKRLPISDFERTPKK